MQRLYATKSYTDIARETPSPRDAWRDDKLIEKESEPCAERADDEPQKEKQKRTRNKKVKR